MHRSRLAYLVARAGGSANELWELFGDRLKTAEGKQIEAVVVKTPFYKRAKG